MSELQDRKKLRSVALILLKELGQFARKTPIRICSRCSVETSETFGWSLILGRLDRGSTRLELWFDRYTKAKERRFWFGFYSTNPKNIQRIIRNSPKHLLPKLEIKESGVEKSVNHNWQLKLKLKRNEFNRPIRETYTKSKYYYYGQFDPSAHVSSKNAGLISRRAMAFFEEILEAQPLGKKTEQEWNVYPKKENRRVVRQHLSRERSRTLAEFCKERDKYRCQVCKIRFEEVYGKIGRGFAEAHHLVPLNHIRKQTITLPDDLITVCSNCHRMLHLLEGKREDFKKLRRLLKLRRR
jgi:5-methylcytosine-specific restriction endonuclease McrA